MRPIPGDDLHVGPLPFDQVTTPARGAGEEQVDLVGPADRTNLVGDHVGVAEGPAVVLTPLLVHLLVADAFVEVLPERRQRGSQLLEPDCSSERRDHLSGQVEVGEVPDDLVLAEDPAMAEATTDGSISPTWTVPSSTEITM